MIPYCVCVCVLYVGNIFLNHPRIYLLIFFLGERNGERLMWKTLISCLPHAPWPGIEPATWLCALTKDPTSNLLVHGMVLQPTEPLSPGDNIVLTAFSLFHQSFIAGILDCFQSCCHLTAAVNILHISLPEAENWTPMVISMRLWGTTPLNIRLFQQRVRFQGGNSSNSGPTLLKAEMWPSVVVIPYRWVLYFLGFSLSFHFPVAFLRPASPVTLLAWFLEHWICALSLVHQFKTFKVMVLKCFCLNAFNTLCHSFLTRS